MEDQNNSSSIRGPDLPSNYVSLLQLREHWLKEKERKEKQKQGEHEEAEAIADAEACRKQRQETCGETRRNSDRENRRSTVPASHTEETKAVTVADIGESMNANGNDNENENERVSAKGVRSKWGRERKKKNAEEQERKKKEQGVDEEEKGVGHEVHSQLDESGKVNVARRRYGRKKGRGMKKPDLTVEIEQKFGDVSIDEKDEKVEEQHKDVGCGSGKNRGCNRDDYHQNGRNGSVHLRINHGDGWDKGGHGRSNRGNGWDRGGYGRINRGDGWLRGEYGRINCGRGWNRPGYGTINRGNGWDRAGRREKEMIWVKKEEVGGRLHAARDESLRALE